MKSFLLSGTLAAALALGSGGLDQRIRQRLGLGKAAAAERQRRGDPSPRLKLLGSLRAQQKARARLERTAG